MALKEDLHMQGDIKKCMCAQLYYYGYIKTDETCAIV